MVAERSSVEAAGSSKPQIHKGSSARESAYVRCSESHSECDYGECVVAIHVPPIKGTAQVKFKVVDGTEPTLSMAMLVANGNKIGLQRRKRLVDHGERRTCAVDKY